MFRGKTTINDVLEMDNITFRTLLEVRSEELKDDEAKNAEAGEQLQEDIEAGG